MDINEIFLSLQGEGVNTGLPTVFVRTQGCNLRCTWCDTKYAYYKGKPMSVPQIVEECTRKGVKRVCLTGGEPLLQEDSIVLIHSLLNDGFEVSVETNGSIELVGIPTEAMISMDIKCPSSGMVDKMHFENLSLLKPHDQVKFVIQDKQDYEYAVGIVKKHNLEGLTRVIFQPVYGAGFSKRLVEKILKDKLRVRFGYQLQKVIWGNRRGV